MKNIIKKILRESDDFDWVDEDKTDLPPIKEIHEWCDKNRNKISNWIQKIDEFYKRSPQMNWGNQNDFNDDGRMIALALKSVGDELRNIDGSFETISGEVDFINNPKMFDDEEH